MRDHENSNEIYTRIVKIVSNILCIKECAITEHSRFVEDLGADSLDQLMLVLALEDEFGTPITDQDAQSLTSIEAAVSFISHLVSTKLAYS